MRAPPDRGARAANKEASCAPSPSWLVGRGQSFSGTTRDSTTPSTGRLVCRGASDELSQAGQVPKLVSGDAAGERFLAATIDPHGGDAELVAGDDVVEVALRRVQPARAADPLARGGEVRARRLV